MTEKWQNWQITVLLITYCIAYNLQPVFVSRTFAIISTNSKKVNKKESK